MRKFGLWEALLVDFYINWPTVTVIGVVAAMIALGWQAVRLAVWSTRIILRPRQPGKGRDELTARDGAGV